MTKEAALASDVLLMFVTSIAGVEFGWFLRKGLATGIAETRYGDYARGNQPGGFWTAIVGFAAAALLAVLGFVAVLVDLLRG